MWNCTPMLAKSHFPFPLTQSWKCCSWQFSGAGSRASVRSIPPTGSWFCTASGSFPSSSRLCGSIRLWAMWADAGEPRERAPHNRSPKRTKRAYVSQISELAVATPTFGHWPVPSVTYRKVPSQHHPDFTGHACRLQLSGNTAPMARL